MCLSLLWIKACFHAQVLLRQFQHIREAWIDGLNEMQELRQAIVEEIQNGSSKTAAFDLIRRELDGLFLSIRTVNRHLSFIDGLKKVSVFLGLGATTLTVAAIGFNFIHSGSSENAITAFLIPTCLSMFKTFIAVLMLVHLILVLSSIALRCTPSSRQKRGSFKVDPPGFLCL